MKTNLKHIFKRSMALVLTLMLVTTFSIGTVYAQTSGTATDTTPAVVDNIENQMEFMYIESPELEAPGTQNIAISWDDSIAKTSSLELVFKDADDNIHTLKESERTATSVLFSKDFSENETGTYTLTGVNYTVGNTMGFFEFVNVEIKADFTVVDNTETQPEDDQILIAEQTTDSINEEAIEDLVTETLEAALPAAATDNTDDTIVIALDPGHGSYEPGASYDFKEHQLVSRIAKYCREELYKYDNVEVYLTHNGTGFTGSAADRMQARVDYAASKDADALLSLHLNATDAHNASGAEVWYPNENYVPEMNTIGKPLAQAVQNELVKLGLKDRGIKERSTVDDKYPDGTVQDWYGIIRRCKLSGIPGIIVEHAFLDSDSDVENFLSSEDKLKSLARADAQGIVNHFGLSLKEAGSDISGPTLTSFDYSADTVIVPGSVKINMTVTDAESMPETVKLTLTNSTSGDSIVLTDFNADMVATRTGYFQADFPEGNSQGGKYYVSEIIIADTYGHESAYNTVDGTLEQKFFTVDSLHNAQEALDKLADLTVTKDNLEESKATVAEARAAYDALSTADKNALGKDVELTLVKAERDIAKVEKEAATAALAVAKESVGTIKATTSIVNKTASNLKFTWNATKSADNYQVVLFRNGKQIKKVSTSNISYTFKQYARGYKYSVKVTPYVDFAGESYYGKTSGKSMTVKHGIATLKVSKSGKFCTLTSENRNSTGFQISISTSKNFDKKVKTYKFTTNKNALNKKLEIAKYFNKGTNYVKVRAYTKLYNQTVYGGWSSPLKVVR